MRFSIIFLMLFNVCANGQKNNMHSFKLQSAILGEERFFDIYLPASPGKFETIYVLDGQALFKNMVNTLQQVGQTQKIVIGIGNIWQRNRDYTPTHVNRPVFVDSTAASVSGGGEKFIAHLEKELIPYINAHYPADSSRTIIGHSFGGLIATDMLLDHPGLFNRYVIIDPSIWWDDARLLQHSREQLAKIKRPIKLFLAIANTRNKDRENIEAIKIDTTRHTAPIRPTISFIDQLKTNKTGNIQFAWKFYREEDHMSVFQPAARDGLKFLFQ
jgi:predicted alpha/beta superfamily hydrolase